MALLSLSSLCICQTDLDSNDTFPFTLLVILWGSGKMLELCSTSQLDPVVTCVLWNGSIRRKAEYLPDIALGFRSEKRWTIEKNETWSVIFG